MIVIDRNTEQKEKCQLHIEDKKKKKKKILKKWLIHVDPEIWEAETGGLLEPKNLLEVSPGYAWIYPSPSLSNR